MRFVLWLFAALALPDFAPAIAESSRVTKHGLVRGESVGTPAHHRQPAEAGAEITAFAAAGGECLPEPARPGADPALDADDFSAAERLVPRGTCGSSAGMATTQCPDGQPFAAFNSRAPPLIG